MSRYITSMRPEIGPVAVIVLIGATAAFGLYSKRTVDELPMSVFVSHGRPPSVSAFRLVDASDDRNHSTKLPQKVERTISRYPMIVAKWAKYSVDTRMNQDVLRAATVSLHDTQGKSWPSAWIWSGRDVFVFVPKGYSEVRPLRATLTLGSRTLMSASYPELPKLLPAHRPVATGPWPGLVTWISPGSYAGSQFTSLRLSTTLPAGHVLMAKVLGSSATESEREERVHLVVANTPLYPNYQEALPIGFYYPETTDEAYVEVDEMAPSQTTARLTFPKVIKYRNPDGFSIDYSRRSVRLPTGERITLSPGRFIGRSELPPRGPSFLMALTSDRFMGEAEATLVSPASIGGTPIVLRNRISTVASSPVDGRSPVQADSPPGASDVVVDLTANLYTPVRKAVLVVKGMKGMKGMR